MVQHFHNGPGEKAEAFSVIRAAVQLRAAEILLVIQKIPRDTVLFQGEQAAVGVPPRKIDIIVAQKVSWSAKRSFTRRYSGRITAVSTP